MSLRILLFVAGLVAAGPAFADGYGTFAPSKPRTGAFGAAGAAQPKPSFVGAELPGSGVGASRVRRPGVSGPPDVAQPAAFKPYEPWKPNTSTTTTFGTGVRPKR